MLGLFWFMLLSFYDCIVALIETGYSKRFKGNRELQTHDLENLGISAVFILSMFIPGLPIRGYFGKLWTNLPLIAILLLVVVGVLGFITDSSSKKYQKIYSLRSLWFAVTVGLTLLFWNSF